MFMKQFNYKNFVVSSFAALAAIFIAVGGAEAQSMEDHHARIPTINTTGEATVSVQPDQARIELGVTTVVPLDTERTPGVASRLRALAADVEGGHRVPQAQGHVGVLAVRRERHRGHTIGMVEHQAFLVASLPPVVPLEGSLVLFGSRRDMSLQDLLHADDVGHLGRVVGQAEPHRLGVRRGRAQVEVLPRLVTGREGRTGGVLVDGNVVNKGVQCEGCHGPAAAHVADETNKVGLTKTPSARVCEGCHNDKSPHYRGFIFQGMSKLVHAIPKK